eukprot:1937131-Lingulodinium_polyedra.AAC.1
MRGIREPLPPAQPGVGRGPLRRNASGDTPGRSFASFARSCDSGRSPGCGGERRLRRRDRLFPADCLPTRGRQRSG